MHRSQTMKGSTETFIDGRKWFVILSFLTGRHFWPDDFRAKSDRCFPIRN